jgi:hypothetical protein
MWRSLLQRGHADLNILDRLLRVIEHAVGGPRAGDGGAFVSTIIFSSVETAAPVAC